MNRTFKAASAALFFAVGFAGSAVAGPLENIDAAFEKGDFGTALRLIRPLAEQGNAVAQFNLAIIYARGRGVPQDYATAVSWLRKSADQGDADAQNNLGFMYEMGRGVPQDFAAALSWFARPQIRAMSKLNAISG
jgi:TPR repeat protein